MSARFAPRSPVRLAANRTLDLAKAGEPVPAWAVTQALVVTGDLVSAGPEARASRHPASWSLGEFGLLQPTSWLEIEP